MSDGQYTVQYLERDLDEFYSTLSSLSSAVNGAGIDWNDEQHEDLARSVRGIAEASSSMMISGADFIDVYSQFLRI